MPAGIFLVVKDLIVIEGYTGKWAYHAAWRNYRTICAALGKEKVNRITVNEYAEYMKIKPQEIYNALGMN